LTMQHDEMDSEPIGRISSGIQPNTLVQHTIAFLQQHLPDWRDDPHRPPEQAEDRLTAQLPKYLNRHSIMFQFFSQEPQPGSHSVDLAVTPSTWHSSTGVFAPIMIVFSISNVNAYLRRPLNRVKGIRLRHYETLRGIATFQIGHSWP